MIKEIASAGALLAVLAWPSRSALAQTTPTLQPALAPIAFLLGSWASTAGTVADTGETATGRSTISLEVGGRVYADRDGHAAPQHVESLSTCVRRAASERSELRETPELRAL
jgi:hypothetical protein